MNKIPLRSFYSKIAGTSHTNDDGKSRQKILKKCKKGERLNLIPSPFEGHPTAIKVCRQNGEQLGWLRSGLSNEIFSFMAAGGEADAEISEVTGGGWLFKKTRGCNIKINKY